MRLRNVFLVASALFVFSSATVLAANGEDMTVINKTGHTVAVFLVQSDNPDLDPDDGVQVATLANGKSGVAHVPSCHFEIILVDHEDIWHAEFHDCNSSSITFTKD